MMNLKRFIPALLVVFAGIWLMDFLVHGVWLAGTYRDTFELWRPEADMKALMPWMLLGQFLVALAFTSIYAIWVADRCGWKGAMLYGAAMGLFSGGGQVIMYAVQPFPCLLVCQWFIAGMIQGAVLGLLLRMVYRPAVKAD